MLQRLRAQCSGPLNHLRGRCVGYSTVRSHDAVIIGGGVLGNACALELNRQGLKTLTIDRHPSPGYGSTSSSSSIVRVFYSELESCKLSWEGYWGWRHWSKYIDASSDCELCNFHETGGLVFDVSSSPNNATYLSRVKSSMAELAVPCETWDMAELKKRLPYFSTTSYFPPRRADDDRFGEENGSELAGAFYTSHTGYVDESQLAARNLADAAKRLGAEFSWGCMVTGIKLDSSGTRVCGVILSDGSSVDAPIVVNAAGPHSAKVHQLAYQNAEVADDSVVTSRPLRVEVAYVPTQDVDLSNMPWVADLDVGMYMRPQGQGQLLIGSSEPACDTLDFLDEPEDLHAELSDEWTNYVYRAALRIPSLPVPGSATGLVDLYDVSPDWSPIYDRTSLGGFYSLRGTSGNQFKNAPVVGKIMAHIIDQCEAGHNHDVEPVELKLEYTSQVLNCGLFSRLRKGSDTSGSVLG